jgi:D-3-phosphoglycerate dehydrogenase / 2-oxoglutarate reductase
MLKYKTILIDFDSTFTQVEALDVLADIALEGVADKQLIKQKIVSITQDAMLGKIPFDEALAQRLALIPVSKKAIEQLINELKQKISISILKNKSFFQTFASQIYIVSGGFFDFIFPIVEPFGIQQNHVYANNFIYNVHDDVVGFDANNPLSQAQGKVKLLEQLNLPKPACIIGDGYTDYEIKHFAQAETFFLFAENISRNSLVELADYKLNSFDEFVKLFNNI